jgi:type IV secretion system protein VirB3
VAGVIGFRDPIFRGCTRPAMLVGVPMIPLLVITGTFMLASMWCMYLVSVYVSLFLIIAYVPIVVTMRQITKKDDQRLRQMLLRARMRVRHAAGREFWSAISYSPIRIKKRKVMA